MYSAYDGTMINSINSVAAVVHWHMGFIPILYIDSRMNSTQHSAQHISVMQKLNVSASDNKTEKSSRAQNDVCYQCAIQSIFLLIFFPAICH